MFWSSVSWPHQTLLNCCWVRWCPQGSHGVVVTRSVKSMCLKEGMACVEWLPPLRSLISIRPCLILTHSVRPKMGTYRTIKTCSWKQRFPTGIWGCLGVPSSKPTSLVWAITVKMANNRTRYCNLFMFQIVIYSDYICVTNCQMVRPINVPWATSFFFLFVIKNHQISSTFAPPGCFLKAITARCERSTCASIWSPFFRLERMHGAVKGISRDLMGFQGDFMWFNGISRGYIWWDICCLPGLVMSK